MTVSVFVGTSLDGFIARPNGDFDFLPEGSGEPHGYNEFFASVDALVIGRKTFEKVLTFATWPYGDKPVFVLSSRALIPAPPGAVVERMSGDPAGNRGTTCRARRRACLRRWRDYHSAVSPCRAHPAHRHHARSCAHWRRDPALWCGTARHRPEARSNAPVRQRPRPE